MWLLELELELELEPELELELELVLVLALVSALWVAVRESRRDSNPAAASCETQTWCGTQTRSRITAAPHTNIPERWGR